MTPRELATLHAKCFDVPRPWKEEEFDNLLSSAIILSCDKGFLVGQLIADEAELLTLAVHPNARREGTGEKLTRRFIEDMTMKKAYRIHLEVRSDNLAAIALYHKLGFRKVGKRKNYYRYPDGRKIDADLMLHSIARI